MASWFTRRVANFKTGLRNRKVAGLEAKISTNKGSGVFWEIEELLKTPGVAALNGLGKIIRTHSDHNARITVIQELGKTRRPGAAKHIAWILSQPIRGSVAVGREKQLRLAAIEALGAHGSAQAVAHLRKAFSGDVGEMNGIISALSRNDHRDATSALAEITVRHLDICSLLDWYATEPCLKLKPSWQAINALRTAIAGAPLGQRGLSPARKILQRLEESAAKRT